MNVSAFEHAKEGSVVKLDPRTKLLLLLVINIVLISGEITGIEFYIRIVLAAIPFGLLLSEKKIKVAIIYLGAFTFATFGESVIVQNTTGIINIVFLIISGLISRFMPSIVMSHYMMTTTTVSEFIASMERMHVTEKLIIPISVMFRYFPTIAEENYAISNAMKMRGIGISGGTKNPFTLLEYRLVPIMMSTVKIGDELSAASLTKGLGGSVKRTNMCQIGINALDVVLMVVGSALFILFLMF